MAEIFFRNLENANVLIRQLLKNEIQRAFDLLERQNCTKNC